MIPKIIHYCWFGGSEKPSNVANYINQWENILVDYEFIEWNEDSFNVKGNQYVSEAYSCNKYAFVSDYVRLYALYAFGGIYLDTDVEVLKDFDDVIDCSAFCGFESNDRLMTAVIGSEKKNGWIKVLLDSYNDKKFINADGSYNDVTNVTYITDIATRQFGLVLNGKAQILEKDLCIYESDFFSPKDYNTGRLKVTSNTITIHHFTGTWKSKHELRKEKIRRLIVRLISMKIYFMLMDKKNVVLNKINYKK